MAATDTVQCVFNEDGDATLLARVTARNGSGAATGVNGEGNYLQIADVSTITCDVYDRSSSTPDTAINSPTVTVASAILNTVVTANTIWTDTAAGYNFIFDLDSTNFPTGGHNYLVECYFTLAGGAKFPVRFEGVAKRRVGG